VRDCRLPPNWTLSTANRLMLKSPRVHPRQARVELKLWGHRPSGLECAAPAESGIGLLSAHDLEKQQNFLLFRR